MLRAHNDLKNGGIDATVDRLSPSELAAAVNGFEYSGREDLASSIREAAALDLSVNSDCDFQQLQERYDAAVPGDSHLEELFRRQRAEKPHDFAPAP